MSNSPWAGTGYGVQTAEIIPRLQADGHEVTVAGNYGHFGRIIDWQGIRIFPASHDQALNDVIRAYSDSVQADWTISLYDVWTMQRDRWPERVASWVPIDHQPAPIEVVNWCRKVTPIAMSRFGQRMLRDQGIDSTYIPHSVNTEVFRPAPFDRAALNIPEDAFVILIAAANKGVSPPRKAWGEMFDAVAYVMDRRKDVYLYVHTNAAVPPQGVDLHLLARQCGIPEDRLRFTDPFRLHLGQIGQKHLAGMYSMADVLLASSMGEGFGVPVIEAQACGLPVIVSDWTAQPELCASGWLVKVQPWRDPLQHSSAFATPYIGSIVSRLEEAHEAKGDTKLREQAVEFAQAYDTAKVYDAYWRPFLAELEAMLLPNRAARRAAKKKRRAA
jgi:glycosyltransferase involved in cell wall biosynthesis